jgi:hypothetical protein
VVFGPKDLPQLDAALVAHRLLWVTHAIARPLLG